MNIIEENHYVTIPKWEYEGMLKVVNEKKDVKIVFELVIDKRSDFIEHFFGRELVYARELVYEFNDILPYKDIVVGTRNLINAACKEVEKDKDESMQDLKDELQHIKSKWWYKLFGSTYYKNDSI